MVGRNSQALAEARAVAGVRFTRRQALVAGGLGTVGLSLPQLLMAESNSRTKAAKSVILVMPWGGPSQHDTFDPKPDAPDDIRSVYRDIATRTAGLRAGEHFSQLASISERFSVLRAVSHDIGVHHAATHFALTGYRPRVTNREVTAAAREDYPTMGSVLAKVKPSPRGTCSFVQLPHTLVDQNTSSNGQNAGFLGITYDPLVITQDSKTAEFRVPGTSFPEGVDSDRFESRSSLLRQLDALGASLSDSSKIGNMNVCYEQAFDLMRSAASRELFDVSREPARVRERYGKHVGQSMLMARRLVEGGVRLVFVNDAHNSMKWDTHDPNYGGGVERHMRETDQALSALLEDLDERGLLETTIVAWMGEFGRTPKRKPDGGRDHWPAVYSVLLAGGGIGGGRVIGASDSLGAQPKEGKVSPGDILTTIYHLLGLPLTTEIHDPQGRPIPICTGQVIRSLI
jgi:hypothetical protein